MKESILPRDVFDRLRAMVSPKKRFESGKSINCNNPDCSVCFNPQSFGQQYCSQRCARHARWLRERPAPKLLTSVICKNIECGICFEQKYFGQAYCSKRCSRRSKILRRNLTGVQRESNRRKKNNRRIRRKAEGLPLENSGHMSIGRQRNKDYVYKDKILKGCSRCPERRPNCLDYHHVLPALKINEISALVKSSSLKKLKAEIAKCILLCKNCHAIEEHGDGYRSERLIKEST